MEDAPLDEAQIKRARDAFSAAIMGAINRVSDDLAEDQTLPPAEFSTGLLLASCAGLASAIATIVDEHPARLRLVDVAAGETRKVLEHLETADV